MATRPKACPFCGHKSPREEVYQCNEGAGVRLVCDKCGAEGPVIMAGLLAKAIKPQHWQQAYRLWNGRVER